ncbi:MAG TPA: glycosyltransferase [Bdellovibrionota bacterium]|jgi:glycosyltransferase involved in cell wall biosynthesis|nr:glycosyltransferase [Bdellovibrionota bacterium]
MKSSPKTAVVMLSEIDWDYLWQRHQIFAQHYSERVDEVFYVNRPGMRLPRWRELPYVLRRVWGAFFASSPRASGHERVRVLSPLLFPGEGWLARVLNRMIFVPRLLKNFRGFDKLVLHVYQPTTITRQVIESCRGAYVIYDCVQNFETHPAAGARVRETEAWLISRANLMIADSLNLTSKHRPKRPDLLQVPPGVDDMFLGAVNATVNSAPTKILYYGNIRADLDFEIINALASQPQVELTMIGTLASDVRDRISPRVRVGSKIPYRDLPEKIRAADVLLLPYALNDFTQGILPAKFFECLASGKPILATRLPSIEPFVELVNVVDGPLDVEASLRRLHSKENAALSESRMAFASQSSWGGRFQSFFSRVSDEYLSQR